MTLFFRCKCIIMASKSKLQNRARKACPDLPVAQLAPLPDLLKIACFLAYDERDFRYNDRNTNVKTFLKLTVVKRANGSNNFRNALGLDHSYNTLKATSDCTRKERECSSVEEKPWIHKNKTNNRLYTTIKATLGLQQSKKPKLEIHYQIFNPSLTILSEECP